MALTAQRQLALADLVLLNKCDLVSSDQLARCREAVRSLNSVCRLHDCCRCQVPLDRVLDLHAYDRLTWSDVNRLRLECVDGSGVTVDSGDGVSGGSRASHLDAGISSITVEWLNTSVVDWHQLEDFVHSLIWNTESGCDVTESSCDVTMSVMRMKGVVSVHDEACRLSVQTVGQLCEIDWSSEWRPHETRLVRLVLIGRHLCRQRLVEQFDRQVALCAVGDVGSLR